MCMYVRTYIYVLAHIYISTYVPYAYIRTNVATFISTYIHITQAMTERKYVTRP